MAQFSGSSSISSADFYGRDEGTSNQGDGDDLTQNIAATAKEDFEKLSKTVQEGISSIAALGSAFFLGLNFTYYLKYLKGFSAGKLVFYQNVLQIPLLLPFALNNPGKFSSSGILAMIYLGVLCTGIAYFLVYSGSQTVKKQYIGVLQIIENVIPILFGVLLFKEVLNFQMILGMVILFASILIISFEGRKETL